MIVVSFGGGTNSTAMLVEMVKSGEPCDAIVFADTGGEKPETYTYRDNLSKWLVARGYPAIETVQTRNRAGTYITLEQRCLNKMLPSIAYGKKACSEKHKIRPQERWANNHPLIREEWKAGRAVVKCLGYDADEPHRTLVNHSDAKWQYRHPLIEWNMGRDECIASIAEAGLPQPGKSSCFFCPNSKPREVLALAQDHPALFERAIAMEANAELTEVRGLGRNYSWAALVKFDRDQIKLFDSAPDMPCGCYDEAA